MPRQTGQDETAEFPSHARESSHKKTEVACVRHYGAHGDLFVSAVVDK